MYGTRGRGRGLAAALGVTWCVLVAGPAAGPALAAENASGPAAAPAFRDLPREALHQVERGQDLHLIAGYYYGDARMWERIWQANREAVKNPNRLAVGMVLHIPLDRDWRQPLSYDEWIKGAGVLRARATDGAPPPARAVR